ncbi:Asp23/Gls24 family envelope stress response protein [Candidatus Caldatribacterium saccharofermentans]|uniref:Asp23/Gls24 family envelope stress response protein n=1 Tax=Candidatus Caldatribacterium saccharofermentans TaxID=1454753 RepID=A0A7V4WJD4_9BACT
MKGCEVLLEEGKVTYSFRVLQKLIECLLQSIPGVESLEKNREESIRLDARGDLLSVNLFLILTLERRVPETAWEIQKRVKEKIEKETALRVDHINIYVQGFATGHLSSFSLQGVLKT